jgi:putative acetyltransferase
MNELPVAIRREQRDDYDRVDEIVQSAFGQPQEALLVSALRGRVDPEISLVAVMNDDRGAQRVVGHIYFSPVKVGPELRAAIALGPVAVDPKFQRRAVGSQLCRRGLEVCAEIGEPLVFVLGHPDYYPRFGFVPARPKELYYKNEHFDAAFFVAELTPGAARGFSGEVHFEPEFDG